jgi:6-phosphofructokinase 2
LIKPNKREFGELTGDKVISDDSALAEEANKIIYQGMAQIVVVSLGDKGVLAAWHGNNKWIKSPNVEVSSKVGAGDSMVAGITLSLAAGNGIEDSLLFGVAAGAAAVMTPGTELCRYEDTMRLYNNIKKNIYEKET